MYYKVLNMRQCRQRIRCLQKLLYVKIPSSQNSNWLILVNKTSALFSNRHIPLVNFKNWHMPRSQIVKSCVQIMKVIYTYLTEIMQLSFGYLNQQSQILMIDNRDKKRLKLF